MTAFLLTTIGLIVNCYIWYHNGLEKGRREFRNQSAWWAGFRAGCHEQLKHMQADALKHGIVITAVEPPERATKPQ